MDAYASEIQISLFGTEISLLTKIISLLIFAGKLPENRCGTGVSRTDIASKGPEIAKGQATVHRPQPNYGKLDFVRANCLAASLDVFVFRRLARRKCGRSCAYLFHQWSFDTLRRSRHIRTRAINAAKLKPKKLSELQVRTGYGR
jgi:hypothetical protein